MNRSEKFWNNNAGGYDKEEMKDRDGRIRILDKTRKYLRQEGNVLDYGCATGIVANAIAGEVNGITGIDISPEMIRVARQSAGELNIRNVTYACSTIFDEKLKAGSFDVILAVYLLHLLEDMPGALARIHELLKPGGLFISVTPCLGKRSLAGMGLLLASKLGLIPGMKLFDLPGLEQSITGADFKILETDCLQRKGQQYFIAAEKRVFS
ncbi:class I SAM-dependent methyltransferase [Chitinophaga sp. YIM B06452]|uniref:class I SAM-dependent methyltransferase n=1 Tax=Chitinophaga sp. YIM B06452 TaxID=3082158 RepID=UPI0031FF3F9F